MILRQRIKHDIVNIVICVTCVRHHLLKIELLVPKKNLHGNNHFPKGNSGTKLKLSPFINRFVYLYVSRAVVCFSRTSNTLISLAKSAGLADVRKNDRREVYYERDLFVRAAVSVMRNNKSERLVD